MTGAEAITSLVYWAAHQSLVSCQEPHVLCLLSCINIAVYVQPESTRRKWENETHLTEQQPR